MPATPADNYAAIVKEDVTHPAKLQSTCLLCGAPVAGVASHNCAALTGTSAKVPWASGPQWRDGERSLPPPAFLTEADLERIRAEERVAFVPPPSPPPASRRKAQRAKKRTTKK